MDKTPRRRGMQVVEESRFGVYVWKMPNGQWVGDDQENWLCISAEKGDLKRIQQLTDAVRAYGVEEGSPYFLSGHRMVNDEEYEEQKQRLKWGLIPDTYDIPALVEDLNNKHGN